MYPDWVEKFHVKGTSIKQIRDNYYLYSVTSHSSKDKPYPVSEQRYIGKITQSGLIEPKKVSFLPGVDKLVLLKDVLDLNGCSEKELELLQYLPALKYGAHIYTGKLSAKQKAIISKYFVYNDGEIIQ